MRANGVPAYLVFLDATLREIAQLKPTSLDAHGDKVVALVME